MLRVRALGEPDDAAQRRHLVRTLLGGRVGGPGVEHRPGQSDDASEAVGQRVSAAFSSRTSAAAVVASPLGHRAHARANAWESEESSRAISSASRSWTRPALGEIRSARDRASLTSALICSRAAAASGSATLAVTLTQVMIIAARRRTAELPQHQVLSPMARASGTHGTLSAPTADEVGRARRRQRPGAARAGA